MTAASAPRLSVAAPCYNEEEGIEAVVAEWDAVLLSTGVPAAPVVTVGEALGSAQVRHRGLVHEVPSPTGHGTLQVLGGAAQVDGRPVEPRRPPPRLGEHTEEVLMEAGYTEPDIKELREAGAI